MFLRRLLLSETLSLSFEEKIKKLPKLLTEENIHSHETLVLSKSNTAYDEELLIVEKAIYCSLHTRRQLTSKTIK